MKKVIITFGILVLILLKSEAQNPEQLLLKDYRPESIFKISETKVERAKFSAIDAHSHPYAKTEQEVADWVKIMDKAAIEKTIILTGVHGKAFDDLYKIYSSQKNRFDLWCGIDFTDCDLPGWPEKAIKELERCCNAGAKGVGELSDKGMGLASRTIPLKRIHFDDPRMKPVFLKCAELNMPINIHVADPIWSYQKMDSTNDGLMNGYTWRIDLTKEGIYDHEMLIQTLENAVRDNPKTKFIACHFANCEFDFDRLGKLLDKYSNLFLDNSARFGETAAIPRRTSEFYKVYQDRLLFGTDMGRSQNMYFSAFRILETNDEHFYNFNLFNYHWPCSGLNLPDKILKKIYKTNFTKNFK